MLSAGTKVLAVNYGNAVGTVQGNLTSDGSIVAVKLDITGRQIGCLISQCTVIPETETKTVDIETLGNALAKIDVFYPGLSYQETAVKLFTAL